MISIRFPSVFRPQSSRICNVFESINAHFIAVLADIYNNGLLTQPRGCTDPGLLSDVFHCDSVHKCWTSFKHKNCHVTLTTNSWTLSVNFQQTLQISS